MGGMPKFDSQAVEILWYVALGGAALVLMFIAYKIGRWLGAGSQRKAVEQKENELFQAQRGFKQVYDTELNALREEVEQLRADKKMLDERVEEYRRKAAGYGGLFNSGGKRADAMYALLLENEALEEALFTQNDKLRQERTDAVKEQLRAASYRRVLMSQLMEEGKIPDGSQALGGGPVNKQLPGDTHNHRGPVEGEIEEPGR